MKSLENQEIFKRNPSQKKEVDSCSKSRDVAVPFNLNECSTNRNYDINLYKYFCGPTPKNNNFFKSGVFQKKQNEDETNKNKNLTQLIEIDYSDQQFCKNQSEISGFPIINHVNKNSISEDFSNEKTLKLKSYQKHSKNNFPKFTKLTNLKNFLLDFFKNIQIANFPEFNKIEWLILDSLLKRKIGRGFPRK